MRKSDLTSLRAKTVKELSKAFSDKSKELEKSMLSIASGTEKNFKKAKNLRRDMAQIATILREKEIMEEIVKSKEGKKE